MLTLSTDLYLLADELKIAAPDYFLNVPHIVGAGPEKCEESIHCASGLAARRFSLARKGPICAAAARSKDSQTRFWLSLARWSMFPTDSEEHWDESESPHMRFGSPVA